MFSHPELGLDPPIGSGQEAGRDIFGHLNANMTTTTSGLLEC